MKKTSTLINFSKYINFYLLQYLDEINIFCEIYNSNIDLFKINELLHFKFLCYHNITFIENYNINLSDNYKENEAVLIYFKEEPHIEFILRNTIIQLGSEWSYSIVCNQHNYKFINNIVSKISNLIKIKKVNEDYKKLLYSEMFWYNLDGYKILIYDENSIIYNNKINDFINYDYITTLYNEDNLTNKISIRNKIKMIETLNNRTIINTIPEYIYYYKYLVEHNFNVANIIETLNFNQVISNDCQISFNFLSLLSKYRKSIYIITNIKGGGSLKYINDLIDSYKKYSQIFIITDNDTLNNTLFFDDDILLVQQLFNTDILLEDILNIKKKYNCKIIISIHDFYWLSSDITRNMNLNFPFWHYIYLEKINVSDSIINFFENSDLIIHPSNFTFNIYSKYFNNNNFKIISHNDYNIDSPSAYIPEIKDNIINIGFLHDYNKYKGKEKIDILINKYSYYKDYKINFLLTNKNIPSYEPSNFIKYIEDFNIHCLTLLNKWGETYCYSLTLYLISGLPLLYNNFGALKERIISNENYFKVYETEEEYNDNVKLFTVFENMLNYIIENNGKFIKKEKELTMKCNNFYDYLFNVKKDYSIIHDKIKPFCIYFPQFHKILENDINYYDNMTDITNLNKYLESTNNEEYLDKPNKYYINLNNILEYDLTNENIIEKQIETAIEYGIYGFSIYYYWFSHNEITNNNLIMDTVYNNFFSKKYNNFKVFFIWANEDWSNNPAFNSSKVIKNDYSEEYLIQNIKNLIIYFKHDNYYKINNRPIFYIHHPWVISLEKLALFRNLLNKECKKNNLNDVYLFLNSSEKNYRDYYNYSINPNYKINTNANCIINNKNLIDYEKYLIYLKNKKESDNECLFFNFNNTARLYIPNKLNLKTGTINNNIFNISKFIDITFSKYDITNDEVKKIVLINSWNEWGEDMAIEPSENKDKLYLNLIKFKLLRFIN